MIEDNCAPNRNQCDIRYNITPYTTCLCSNPASIRTGNISHDRAISNVPAKWCNIASCCFRWHRRSSDTFKFTNIWYGTAWGGIWRARSISLPSSSARRSPALCGCTLACSHWTCGQLLSLQANLGLGHTGATANGTKLRLVQQKHNTVYMQIILIGNITRLLSLHVVISHTFQNFAYARERDLLQKKTFFSCLYQDKIQ
jgi:hypothetical protein